MSDLDGWAGELIVLGTKYGRARTEFMFCTGVCVNGERGESWNGTFTRGMLFIGCKGLRYEWTEWRDVKRSARAFEALLFHGEQGV